MSWFNLHIPKIVSVRYSDWLEHNKPMPTAFPRYGQQFKAGRTSSQTWISGNLFICLGPGSFLTLVFWAGSLWPVLFGPDYWFPRLVQWTPPCNILQYKWNSSQLLLLFYDPVLLKQGLMSLAQGQNLNAVTLCAADEARTRKPSVSSQARYHWTTALPHSYLMDDLKHTYVIPHMK